MLVSALYDQVRAILNDTGEAVYTDSVLEPFLSIANNELSDYLITNGIPVQKEIDEEIEVDAGVTELQLPTDLIIPVRLFERAQGSTNDDDWEPMLRKAWEPNQARVAYLQYWVWRNQEILFLGATTDREVRLHYIRALADITEETTVEVIGSSNFLSYKTAALAVSSVGGNDVEAGKWDGIAGGHRDRLLNIGVRNQQSLRRRRKPFRLRMFRNYL